MGNAVFHKKRQRKRERNIEGRVWVKKSNNKTHLLCKGSSAWAAEVSQGKVGVLLSHTFFISDFISPYTQRQMDGLCTGFHISP